MEQVTVIVTNYNGQPYLEECLRSIREAGGPILEVLLVDDGSTDSSVAFTKRDFPWVNIIALPRNMGPAVARNIGIDVSSTELVLLLDNDVVVGKGWLEPMVETVLRREDAFVCCSRVLFYEYPGIIGEDGLEAHFLGMPTRRKAGKRVSQEMDTMPTEVGSTAGISMMIRKSVLKKTGGFDGRFYYNLEDLDFCLNGRLMGYKCLVVPQSLVYHKYITGGTKGLTDSEVRYSQARAFYLFRNRWYIIVKFYSLKTIMILAPALVVFEGIAFTFAVKKRVFFSYLWAVRSFFRNLLPVLRERRFIQESRLISDKDLLCSFPLSLGRGTATGNFEKRMVDVLDLFCEKYWRAARSLI